MEKIKNAVSFIKTHKIIFWVMLFYAISFAIFVKFDVLKVLWGMADENIFWFLFWIVATPPAMSVVIFLVIKFLLSLIIADLGSPSEERNCLSEMVLYKDLSDGKSFSEARAHADLYK